MKIYLSPTQKSSNFTESSFNSRYGLRRSVVLWAIRAGLIAHLRLYEAALRLGMRETVFTASDFIAWLAEFGIIISMATAQRALTDSTFFEFVGLRRSGKRGRPQKRYMLVPPLKLGEHLGIPMDASINAPVLAAVDVSSVRHFKLAYLGREMVFMDESTREQQIKMWGWSKPTLIRWTREVCEITPQYERLSSNNINFTVPINGEDGFYYEVRKRQETGSGRYWLEVTDENGEIRKLPCKVDLAKEWLPKSEVVIYEQRANRYQVHAAYRDPTFMGDFLPY